MQVKIFSIAGWSGSGKTNLITKLIKKFKSKNKRVFVVKNVPHKYHLEPEAKDSFCFLKAGSDEVFLVAQKEIVSMQKNDREGKIFEILQTKTGSSDLVLLEGLYRSDIPVIEVFDSQKNKAPRFSLKKLSALVTDKENMGTVPCFRFDDLDGVVRFMEDYDG